MSKGSWKLTTWLYFASVVGLGAATVGASVHALAVGPSQEQWWLVLLLLMPILERTYIQLPNMTARICPTGILTQFVALRFGVAEGVLFALVEAIVVSRQQTADRKRRMAFNAGAFTFSIFIASVLGHAALPPGAGAWDVQIAAMVTALTYFVFNVGLVLGMMALTAGIGALAQARSALLWSWAPYAVGGMAAALLTVASGSVPSALALTVGLTVLGVTAAALHHYFNTLRQRDGALLEVERLLGQKDELLGEVRQTHLAALKTLATAIEAKDPMTHGHVVRVEALAMEVARAAGIAGDALEAVRVGAMLHDIGKLAMPEYLLHPNRKLTEEDRVRLRSHAHLGAAILSNARLHPDVVPMIRHHHERFDGGGYPSGLRGPAIPLGARILAVADTYDKVRHPAAGRGLSVVEAAEQLRRQMGSALDPWLVELLLDEGGRLLDVVEAGLGAEGFAPTAATDTATRALGELEWQHRESAVVFGLGERLRGTLDPKEMIQALCEALAHLVLCEAILVFVPAEDGTDRMEVGGVWGGSRVEADDLCRAGWPGRLLVPLGAEAFMVLGEADATAVGARGPVALARMRMNAGADGLVVLRHPPGFEYDDNRRRAVGLLAEHSGAAVGNARAFRRFQELSVTDALTGLHNARHLREQAPNVLQTALTTGEGGCVVMMDLNGFKGVNDTLGHDHGDALLVGFARVLRRHTRREDLVIRKGGDEFVVVFPGITLDALHGRLEKIDAEACELWPDGWTHPRGTSVGLARFPEEGRTLDALLKLADDRMYQDKQRRRAAREDREAG